MPFGRLFLGSPVRVIVVHPCKGISFSSRSGRRSPGLLNSAVALSCFCCSASLSPCTCHSESCCTVSLSPHTGHFRIKTSDQNLSRPPGPPLLDSLSSKGTVPQPDLAVSRRVGALRCKWYCVRDPRALFLFPFCLASNFVSNVTSACERKRGKTSVILPHGLRTRCRACGADALPFIASPLNPRWAGGRALVLCRVA